jgi:hypothetical protein
MHITDYLTNDFYARKVVNMAPESIGSLRDRPANDNTNVNAIFCAVPACMHKIALLLSLAGRSLKLSNK